MTKSLYERASAYATARIQAAGGDPTLLSLPEQTVVVVETVQGIIDNGGLEYLYENDFPGNPPYSFFVDSFRRIGADSVASCVETTAAMFPFPEPHLHCDARLEWLDKVREDTSHEFVRLSRLACGDESVFPKLEAYVQQNRDAFNAV